MTQQENTIAWRPIRLVAGVTALIMFVLSGRYGPHRDELYYLVAGRHPAWGYDDQPPLVPLWAGVANRLAGDAPDWAMLTLLRLPSTLAVAAIIVLTALIAARMGAGRRAQLIAAVAAAATPVVIFSGHLLSTTVFDVLAWTLIAYLLISWIVTRRDSFLLTLGPVAGVALLVKSLPVIYLAALLIGLLISGPREIFRRWQLWAAGAIAALCWAPNLWWQATHGWPQLEMTAVIREDADFGGRLGLIPSQLLMVGIPAAIVWGVGLWLLLRDPARLALRAFGWAYLIVIVIVLATGGREYYPVGAYPALLAAGAIAVDGWVSRGEAAGSTGRRTTLWVTAGISAAITVILGLPIYPVSWLPATPQAAVNYDAGETVGWPAMAAQVADVYRTLTPAEQASAVILAGNYGESGALDRYGPRHGLPPVYSGHLAFWRWGPPDTSGTPIAGPVIVVGWRSAAFGPLAGCASFEQAATVDNGLDLDNEEQGAPVGVCRDPARSWSEIWPQLRRL